MTKEYLEDLMIEFDEMGYEPTILCDTEREVNSFRNRLKQVLDYLKAIENTKPSEALEKLDKILDYFGEAQIETMTLSKCNILTIKKALQKAQEKENLK